MFIKTHLESLRKTIPETVCLVAVSKTKPNEDILEAYQNGQRHFGENNAREMQAKAQALPKDIHWHFIGHLQTNKVKYIAPWVDLIHSVDSLKVLKEIDRQAEKNGKTIRCLLQFHIAEEETKFGLNLQEAEQLINSPEFKTMAHIQLSGVMGMATYTENQTQIRREFKQLKVWFDHLKIHYFSETPEFKEISMGMSGDYQLAIEEKSTLVRIGSLIFGARSCVL
ncbi:MAG: YggS family pyridoxal phosphate-dependent enzyme [Bacteroidales bacterium]|nr:YggS family pyridoxal phosphate-dependent enzyme [Bacteroidales bacterium]